ncbi:MAG: PfkB family carbohydrate kinase [Phycisphaerae bacterium]|jgi:rfaE bifunctional protein kinase chain/domain|nr:PfkB family carbohydrate kinase [Phycisphaerae bacterium]
MQDPKTSNQPGWANNALDAASRARVTVFGDFALDAYWAIDPDLSELSVETLLPVRRVQKQHYSLGGAANVAANLLALGAAEVRAVGMVGDDLFGRELLLRLEDIGADTTDMLTCQADWQTQVFAKPHLNDTEQNRMDFGGFNVPTPESVEALAAALDAAAVRSDAIILNQQVPAGISTEAMIERLNALIARYEDKVFVIDSRHRPGAYRRGFLKMNSHEAAELDGRTVDLSTAIPADEAVRLARRACERTGRPVFVTRGAEGIIVAESSGVHVEPGIPADGPIDPVGAGDTVTAALGAVLGGGGQPVLAARLANVAARVTVGKLQTTGTAGPSEILAIAACTER